MREGRGQQAETRQDMQVEGVVGAADEEEEVGAGAVLRAEEHRAHGAPEGKERLLEEVGVVVARVEERGTAAGCRGRHLLARLKLGEQRLGVVEETGGVGEVRHVAQHAGARLGGHGGRDHRRGEEVRDVEVLSVRLAPFGHGELVLPGELLVGDRHEAALGPFVEETVFKEEVVPASDAGDLLALREVPKVVHLHVQMRGGALQIHQLIAHGAYSTTNTALAPVVKSIYAY